MAVWRVASTRGGGLRITYSNAAAGSVFTCGVVRGDTPEPLIIDWVVSQDAAVPWDLVVLPGGRVLQLLPQCGSGQ